MITIPKPLASLTAGRWLFAVSRGFSWLVFSVLAGSTKNVLTQMPNGIVVAPTVRLWI